MAIIGLQKGSGKRSRVREKSVTSQGILIWIMSGNPDFRITSRGKHKHAPFSASPYPNLFFLVKAKKEEENTLYLSN